MRHRVSGKTLGRSKDHRKALLRNLSDALVLKGSIKTTVAKAKFVRPYVEKLVTRAKSKDINTVKYAKTRLFTNEAVRKLVDEIAPQYSTRPGGYTRIVKLGFRDGDNAEMARIEWVSAGKNKVESKKTEANKDEAVKEQNFEKSGKKEKEEKPKPKKRGRPKKSTKEKKEEDK